MKILPLVNSIRNDVANSGKRIKCAYIDGYGIAKRTAEIYNQPNYIKYLNTARIVSDKVIKGATRKEIPYITGAIGVFIPLPLTSPIFLGFGFIIRALISSQKNNNTAI